MGAKTFLSGSPGMIPGYRYARGPEPRTPDTRDTQLAITQILLRNGWENAHGRIIKKVKAPFKYSPDIYVLLPLPNDKLGVRDPRGNFTKKVELKSVLTNAEIMQAASALNSGVVKIVQASDEDSYTYRRA